MNFKTYFKENQKQLIQDFIDDYDDMFMEYCKSKFEGDE